MPQAAGHIFSAGPPAFSRAAAALLARLIHGSDITIGAWIVLIALVALFVFAVFFPWHRPPRE